MLRRIWNWLVVAPEPFYAPPERPRKRTLNMAAHKLSKR